MRKEAALDTVLSLVQNNFVLLFLLILLFLGGFIFGSLQTENDVAKSRRLGTISSPNPALAVPPVTPDPVVPSL